MGILLMNIGGFALPDAAYFNPHAVLHPGPADVGVWAAQFVLVDGKMRNIFSLLFGASMLLVATRAAAKGEDEGQVHLRRMGSLALFGLAHFYLLWWGDILFQYAVIGTVAFFFADRGAGTLVKLGLACLLIQFLLAAGNLAALADLHAHSAPEAWARATAQLGSRDPAALLREATRMRSGYGALVHTRLTTQATLPFTMIVANSPETLGMMLLGMAGLKSGFLTGAWARRRYVRTAFIAYAVALPPLALLALLMIRNGFDPVTAVGGTTLWSLPFRPLIAFGHVALALLWLRGEGLLRARVAAVGRAAFTNYLGSSIVMTSLFYGYGLGLFARLDRLALLGIVVAAWIAMLLWSKPWLDRFAYGPFEWAWRSLARLRPQPMRKVSAS